MSYPFYVWTEPSGPQHGPPRVERNRDCDVVGKFVRTHGLLVDPTDNLYV